MILFTAFAAILLVTFFVMTLVSSPSKGQKAVERRIGSISSGRGETQLGSTETNLLKNTPTGHLDWLDQLLEQYKLSTLLETRIAQANSKTTVAQLLSTSAGFAVVGFIVAYLCIPVLLIQVGIAFALGCLPFTLLSLKRSRRLAAFDAGLADAIDMMGRALRAGHAMTAAIKMVADQSPEPLCAEFGEVYNQQNFGLPLRDAFTQMMDRVPSQDLRVLVTGILVQKETGGNLVEILDRITNVIRERLRIQGEIKTHTAQGRMTGYILCALPIVMLFAINLINPGYSDVLMDTPRGHKLVYVGLGLLTTGGLIIRGIINGIEV